MTLLEIDDKIVTCVQSLSDIKAVHRVDHTCPLILPVLRLL